MHGERRDVKSVLDSARTDDSMLVINLLIGIMSNKDKIRASVFENVLSGESGACII